MLPSQIKTLHVYTIIHNKEGTAEGTVVFKPIVWRFQRRGT